MSLVQVLPCEYKRHTSGVSHTCTLKSHGALLQVSPSEYQRFIYKCHTCMLGFKRRGMLVNHLNKRHPNIKPESVHELSLPILKQQRDYYCQHCDKVG